jgi:hypothetical protein
MVTTNLALAKHVNGACVSREDLKAGLEVYFPSGAGGVVKCQCVSINSEIAHFESTNKDWPFNFVMEFEQPEFTKSDFEYLAEALSAYSKWNVIPTDEQRNMVRKAHSYGYAFSMSYTQAHWTDNGVDAFRSVM